MRAAAERATREQDLAREESNATESDGRATNRVAQRAPEELPMPGNSEKRASVFQVSQAEMNER
jgi:hypothetical protein